VTPHGPITQSEFLQALGIHARVEQLFRNAKSKESRKSILDGAERLMKPEEMGRIYKVLAFSKETEKSIKTPPIGYEGQKQA
jgi:NADH dehydrogenase [ubiquinone] 1 alpha subcomplex assembly factor 7